MAAEPTHPAQVKICGIASREAFEAASAADYVGFVFFPASPRFVTPAQAAAIAGAGGPIRVGLFVDPADATIAETLARVKLDVLQVVGSSERSFAIRQRFGLPVWRALGIRSPEDLPCGLEGSDALLLDASPPARATRPGGNATPFDWSLLAGWKAPGPWLLAGGLTPANVAQALRVTGAPAVDVSSGVERAPGRKDPALIEAFIHAVRGDASS